MDLFNNKSIFKAENNPWIYPIAEAFKIGLNHVAEYLTSDAYEAYVYFLVYF